MDQIQFLKNIICETNPDFGKLNAGIQLHSGEYFYFSEPEKSNYTLDDIAHALSHICRYSGHCNKFYSVAQHCVLASHIHPTKQTLMHDATEAFLSDIPSPLKRILPDYRKIERFIEMSIFKRFNIELDMAPEVKVADIIMLATEKRDLMNDEYGHKWPILEGVEPLPAKIVPWPPEYAKVMFYARAKELGM